MKILIDNGHGIDTPGKRSPVWPDGSQVFEWEYTRSVAKNVVERLVAAGVDAVLLVPEKEDISLNERCRRANTIAKVAGAKNTLIVSIHLNAFNGKARGWEVHTYKGQSISDTFATVMWNEARKQLPGRIMRSEQSDGDPDFDSNFAILRDTICPAILTENLFMDHPDDCAFLLKPEGKKAIEDLHVYGIQKIIDLR